jgi:hypothetical protein
MMGGGGASGTGMAITASGDIYFLSLSNSQVSMLLRRLNASSNTITDVLTFPLDPIANSMYGVTDIELSPDEKLLYATTPRQILSIDLTASPLTAAAVHVFAGVGNGTSTPPPDADGPAAQAIFNNVERATVAPDGTVYVAEYSSIRKIAPDVAHTVSTVVGKNGTHSCFNSSPSLEANGQPANLVGLSASFGPDDIRVAADGALWITSNLALMRVDPSGIVKCFAPPGSVTGGLAIMADQSIYVATAPNFTSDGFRLNKLNPDWTFTTVAGGPNTTCDQPVDGAQAAASKVCNVRAMRPGPDGSLYFEQTTQTLGVRIYKLTLR